MANTDDRLLSFFVSGALLVGGAACSKDKQTDRPTSNPGPQPDHVNEGPAPVDAIDAGATLKAPEPDRVNEGPAPEESGDKPE